MAEGKAILVISSHVARGSVGNRAAVFALETLGFPVWAAPTVILPWHPGHGPATRIVPSDSDFRSFLADLARSPWTGELAAVLTGYLGNAFQAKAVADLVSEIKSRHPGVLHVCDPVIGDQGGLYVQPDTATAIRDHLLPLADIATPNRFELDWLADDRLETNSDILKAAARIGTERLLVTSAHAMMADATANLLVTKRRAVLAEHRMIANAPNGPGDLTAALFLARLLMGQDETGALEKATASVFEVLSRSVKAGSDELLLEREADSLRHPLAMVTLRQLARPAPKRTKT